MSCKFSCNQNSCSTRHNETFGRLRRRLNPECCCTCDCEPPFLKRAAHGPLCCCSDQDKYYIFHPNPPCQYPYTQPHYADCLPGTTCQKNETNNNCTCPKCSPPCCPICNEKKNRAGNCQITPKLPKQRKKQCPCQNADDNNEENDDGCLEIPAECSKDLMALLRRTIAEYKKKLLRSKWKTAW